MTCYNVLDDRKEIRKVLLLIGAASMVLMITNSMMSLFLVDIAYGLGMEMAESTLISIAFLVSMIGFMIVIGKMAETGSIRKIFLIGVAIYCVSAFLCALSSNSLSVIILSFFNGIGGSVLAVAPAVMVVTFIPAQMKGRGMGVLSGMSGLGMVVGPIAGGFIVDTIGWRGIFLLIATASLLPFILGLKWIPAPSSANDGKHKIEIVDAMIISSIVGSFLLLLQTLRLNVDYLRMILIVYIVLASMLFIKREKRKVDGKLFNVDVFKNEGVVAIFLAILISSIMLSGEQFLAPYYLRGPIGLSGTESGFVLAASHALAFISSFFVGKWCDRSGCRTPMLISNCLRALFCIMAIVFASSCLLVTTICMMLVLGLTCGMSGTAHNTRMVHHSKPKDQADAVTFGIMATFLGSSIGMIAYNTVMSITVPEISGKAISELTREEMIACFSNTAVFGLILMIGAIILTCVVRNIDPRKEKVE